MYLGNEDGARRDSNSGLDGRPQGNIVALLLQKATKTKWLLTPRLRFDPHICRTFRPYLEEPDIEFII